MSLLDYFYEEFGKLEPKIVPVPELYKLTIGNLAYIFSEYFKNKREKSG